MIYFFSPGKGVKKMVGRYNNVPDLIGLGWVTVVEKNIDPATLYPNYIPPIIVPNQPRYG